MHTGFNTLSLTTQDFYCSLQLTFDRQNYQVKSNSPELLQALGQYFAGYETRVTSSAVSIYLYDDEVQQPAIQWQKWTAEAGKTRQKEQYCDVEDGRWIHKLKTGMVLFQHLSAPLAIGPCEQFLSQTVNFIINQHINYLQQQGGLICHAACLQVQQQGIAIAALSGGGKSTTMLKLMDLPDSQFISNDRLFLFAESSGIVARGVAKQPRVNPGTLLNNPKLVDILSVKRQQELASMPGNALWQLEEKYDVMVERVYGKASLGHSCPLQQVVLLNWQPGHNAPVSMQSVSLDSRPDLIKAIAKSPGSFYQDARGAFLNAAIIPPNQAYQDRLRSVQVWEVTGGADFAQLTDLLSQKISLQTMSS